MHQLGSKQWELTPFADYLFVMQFCLVILIDFEWINILICYCQHPGSGVMTMKVTMGWVAFRLQSMIKCGISANQKTFLISCCDAFWWLQQTLSEILVLTMSLKGCLNADLGILTCFLIPFMVGDNLKNSFF